jgi:SAM-dependent methyltransferase/uncharacterized protein YbaR (Trm112 family)
VVRVELCERLACPTCRTALRPVSPADGGDLVDGSLACTGGHTFDVVSGIPRFVGGEQYAGSFGFQWNRFAQLQLDSFNGTRFSEERFRAITGWTRRELEGRRVLDAGCGAGRFAEIACRRDGADLAAFDLSAAVDACGRNLSPQPPLLCQASIYEPPFPEGSFDFVYCIGVIQHTPDPERAVRSLCRLVRPGGWIALWIYENDWKSWIGTLGFKRLLRPYVSRWDRDRQLAFCERLGRWFLPLAWHARKLGLAGKAIQRLLPVASGHLRGVPLARPDFETWVVLDTFDAYASAHDTPQRFADVARMLQEEGLEDVERRPHGGVAIRARRPAA